MINPTRIAELAANLRAKWLTEEASALTQLGLGMLVLRGAAERLDAALSADKTHDTSIEVYQAHEALRETLKALDA